MRNFGISKPMMEATLLWGNKPGGSDCLKKTQGSAKLKDEVYGLTPARCWKVKERGASLEPKPQ